MKKIGLITYHNPCNYGATLQALATVKFFKDRNFDIEVIDYTPSSKRGFGKLGSTIKSINGNYAKKICVGIIKNFSYRKMSKSFNRNIDGLFPLSRKYDSIEELRKEPPIVDYYCTGSDQVWNNYYTKQFEEAFFLDFATDNKLCFSYSSSFGKSKFNNKELKEIDKKLKKYKFVTVREKDGLAILRRIGFEKAAQILDPTLMLNREQWNDYVTPNVKAKKYILVYQLHGSSNTIEIAKRFARERGLKIVKISTMYHHLRFGVKNLMLPSFQEFLGYIKNADYVITDSFHGVAFSLIFKKKIGITLPENFSNRITSLLSQIEGENLIVKNYRKWEKEIDKVSLDKIENNLATLREEKIAIFEKMLDENGIRA